VAAGDTHERGSAPRAGVASGTPGGRRDRAAGVGEMAGLGTARPVGVGPALRGAIGLGALFRLLAPCLYRYRYFLLSIARDMYIDTQSRPAKQRAKSSEIGSGSKGPQGTASLCQPFVSYIQ